MRKDELVHLHGLLDLLGSEYERRGVADPSAFEAYEDLGVSPMAVYGSKADHARAVHALADALAAASEAAESADERDESAAVTSP